MIPKNLFRTVPETTTSQVETWWLWATEIHQEWNCVTYRDPLDPADFPLTGHLWDLCHHGAQKAGLIRLELIYTHGGVYIDSDVQVHRSFLDLLGLRMFAGWESETIIPDAIFGAEAGHPALEELIQAASCLLKLGYGPWETGPGVFTDLLPGRQDVTLFPPATFYPYHWSKKKSAAAKANYGRYPWTYAQHNWHASWVPKKR